jgi:hypothetical protein
MSHTRNDLNDSIVQYPHSHTITQIAKEDKRRKKKSKERSKIKIKIITTPYFIIRIAPKHVYTRSLIVIIVVSDYVLVALLLYHFTLFLHMAGP